jgi:hypothetical protein
LNTSKLQGLGLIWVQLRKELYMKNKYKNIKIAKQTKIRKTPTKLTCNIKTKANNTTCAINPNSCA